jgi:CheY-like chemotaxis protein
VICAEDGGKALQLEREQQPDLILLDMIPPKVSGPELLRQRKREPSTAEIPVVVLGSLSKKKRQKSLEEGVDEHLEKNSLMPEKGINLLPKVLENVICRINRRRGIAFSSLPAPR